MFRLKVTLPKLSQIGLKVQRSIKEASVEALRHADETVGREATAQVNSQGARLGLTWKELADVTQKRREKKYPSTYYGKRASASGPARPIGIWTGTLRAALSRPGHLSQRNLTVRREYFGGQTADSSATQRLYWLHAGGIREDKDGFRIQPERKVFHMAQGSPMERAAFNTFLKRFSGAFATAMGRP